jgi:hypothetical protein
VISGSLRGCYVRQDAQVSAHHASGSVRILDSLLIQQLISNLTILDDEHRHAKKIDIDKVA